MSSKTPYYITTAISYVNGRPHLGHAYEAISTDAMARFKRLDGYDVHFLTGTDEHGQKVEKSALDAGQEPQAFTDEIAQYFRDMCALLNISNDDFIRTTESRHYAASQAIWQRLADNGDIYLGKYEGWYSVRDEAYFDDSELTRIRPTRARGWRHGSACGVGRGAKLLFLSAFQGIHSLCLIIMTLTRTFYLPTTRLNEVVSFVGQEGGAS